MKTYEDASKNIPKMTPKKQKSLRGTKGFEKVKYYDGNIWFMDKATGELFGHIPSTY